MTTSSPHIAILYDENVPELFIDDFCSKIADGSLVIDKRSRSTQELHMGIEWLAAPVIALFILKPYIDSFLSAAGKDHYLFLRSSIRSLWGHLYKPGHEFEVKVVTSCGIKKLEYSMAFAVYVKLEDNRILKLLFREDCSEDEFEKSIEAFLIMVSSYCDQTIDSNQKIMLDTARALGGTILLEFNREANAFRVVDPISHSKRKES